MIAAVACAAILLIPSPAPGAEEDFFQKFTPTDPCNWAGFYIGVNNGVTFNHFNLGKQMTDVDLTEQFYDLIGEPGETGDTFATFDIRGHHETDTETIGGGQIGFNLLFGHFLVGAEGGIQGNGTSTSGKFTESQEHGLFLETINSNVIADTDFTSMRMVETIWNGYIGGKLGFCWNRFLFYATGGAAFTDAHFANWEKADTSFFGIGGKAVTPNVPSNFIGEVVSKKMRTQGDVLTGFYGGVGTEYKLTNIVSVGLEYKHVDWGDVTEHFMGGSGPIFSGNGHLDLNADQVVFKVNLLVGPIGH